MIELSEALAIAKSKLDEIERATGEPLAIMEDQTIERPFGWVFFYNTQTYIHTGEMKYMLGGNAPLIVDSSDGSLHETGTAEPIDFYIDEYEKKA